MSGIYFHIPFCQKACHYCDFHFSTSIKQKKALLKCLAQEIEIRNKELQKPVNTIYFGGGTPSILLDSEINDLLTQCKNYFHHQMVYMNLGFMQVQEKLILRYQLVYPTQA